MTAYDRLIEKLDAFIRRFYLNQLIRGSLLFLTGIAGMILLLSLGEYFLYLPAWLKIILLIILSGGSLGVLIFWVILPLMRMQRLGKIISRPQAAMIIGRHFPEVKDKLLNILQLHEKTHAGESLALALAGIEQKSGQISVIPFHKAVDLKKNRRYLKWLLPIILVLGGVALIWPQVFQQAAFRLSQPDKDFYPPAPFTFEIQNPSLEVPLNSNFTLKLKIEGKKLPAQATLVLNGQSLDMQSTGKNTFSYTFQDLQQNTKFHFSAAGFRSADFELKILERPQLESLTVQTEYPHYTGLKNEQLNSLSGIPVPEGTKLHWTFQTKNTTKIGWCFRHQNKEFYLIKSKASKLWHYQFEALKDTAFQLRFSNNALPDFDSLAFSIQVIPDNAPQINARQTKDSISGRQVLIMGNAADDYGLSRLLFHYMITDVSKKTIAEKTIVIVQTNNAKTLNYHYYFDINTLDLLPGQTVRYFTEAWDNDGIHGPKKATSEIFSYEQANQEQLRKAINQNNLAINQQLENSSRSAENINEDLDKFKNQMLQSPDMNWEQQNQLKSIQTQQENLAEKIAALKKRFDLQKRQSREKNYSENIRQKQEELAQQLDKVQSKDLAGLMKKLQDMMSGQQDKSSVFQQLKQWQQQNKLFKMDMERIQELMKQLTLQMKLEDMARKAEELAQKQSGLSRQTENKKGSAQEISRRQKDLEKQLDELMNKDFPEAQKANEATENPQDLSKANQNGKEAGKNMQNSQNSLQQGQMQRAGQQQQQASDNLSQMAANLSKMAGGMDMQMLDINIRAVRQLLTNLLRFSFDQEKLMQSEQSILANLTSLKEHSERQHRLKQNADMIKDSLLALSKRVFQLAPSINKETSQLSGHLDDALSDLENRRIGQARVAQQYAMTNANNLALMLDETLRHLMQMQSKGQQNGSGSSSPMGKPQSQGQGSSPGQMMKDIITRQQQLGKGISQMQGKNGQQQEEQGQNGKENRGNSNQQAEKLAELAQQQAQLRQMMQDISSMLNSQGNGQNAQLIREIQKAMNQNEIDFVNRRLSSELIKRQQQIMTRLLQAQDAIRNQETDNKRLAETAKDIPPPMPAELKAVLEKRKAFLESYQTIPATLNPFYKQMSEKYQKEIGR
ncbi:MAG TPA: hypothetical protein VFL76_11420 [Edaphocola sp.]|nr:hypothetical protein [Edaphocola sp.]